MKKELKQLLKKFEHIDFLDYKIVIENLKQYNSISDKLNYLKTLKEKYYDKYEQVKKSFTYDDEILSLTDNNHSIIHNSIFGKVNLITPLFIQEPVFKKHFKNGIDTPEFTYWFLKYQAKELFNYLTNKEDFKSNLNSNKLRETFIKSELKIIEDEEIKTKELFLNKKIDVYNRLRSDYYNRKEIIILRILDDNYYKKNIADDVFAIGSLIVQAYYKHNLLKPFLTKALNKKTNNSLTFQLQKKRKLSISEIVENYSYLITNEIKNLNTGNGKGYFITNSTRFLNSEFESELKKNTEQIQRSIIHFKNSILNDYKFSLENETYLLENDNLFLEKLHLYIEYRKLLKKDSNKPTKQIGIKNKNSLREIALILAYKGKHITREKCKKIALENGYTSGDALYNHCSYYSSTANRKGKPHPYTSKKLKNKITLFENVFKSIEKPFKNRVLDDITILKTYYKDNFE